MRTQKYTVSCFLEKLMFSLAYHNGGNEAISFKHLTLSITGVERGGIINPFFCKNNPWPNEFDILS